MSESRKGSLQSLQQWQSFRAVRRMAQALMVLVALILLIPPAPALGQTAANWDAVVAAARKEGRVAIYAAAAVPIMERLKADFEKAVPGITMEVLPGTSGAIVAKLDAERNSNADGADVAIITELVWFDARVKEGTLKAPVGPAAAAWPAAYMRGNTYPVLALEPLIVVYNTNVIKTPITGYQDFLRPEFKGTKFGTNTMAATTVIAWYEWLDKSFGADFTTKLAAQQPRMYAGTVQSTQSTAAGEVGATLYSTPGIAIPVADRGAPVKILYPNPSFGIRLGGGIMGWSKRPNAAQVFVNYAMTPRGQTAWVGPLGGTASPLPNIPNSLDPKTINPYDPAQYPPEVVKTLTEKYNRIFQGN